MLLSQTTSTFRKDYKKYSFSGRHDISKIKDVMRKIVNEECLDESLKDHALRGEYRDCRECHIEPDWLLIYKIEGNSVVFVRTGSHSELF